jgi:hypothetical protein
MTTNIRIFTLAVVIVLSVTMMVAQTAYRDVVYLKNGGIVKGTIIETVPEKSIKIETSDGNVFVYNMSDIEKITKEKDIMQRSEPTSLFGGSNVSLPSQFSIFGGAAIPVGDFASTSSSEAGFAKMGFTAGIQFVTGGQIGFLASASYSSNPLDDKIKSMVEEDFVSSSSTSGSNISASVGSYTNILLLAGLKIGTTNTTGINFFFAPIIGLDLAKYPEITVDGSSETYVSTSYYPYYTYVPVTVHATESSSTAAAFVYGATVEAIISDHLTIAAKYIVGKPKYDITIDASASASGYSASTSSNESVEQSIGVFMFCVGYAF